MSIHWTAINNLFANQIFIDVNQKEILNILLLNIKKSTLFLKHCTKTLKGLCEQYLNENFNLKVYEVKHVDGNKGAYFKNVFGFLRYNSI